MVNYQAVAHRQGVWSLYGGISFGIEEYAEAVPGQLAFKDGVIVLGHRTGMNMNINAVCINDVSIRVKCLDDIGSLGSAVGMKDKEWRAGDGMPVRAMQCHAVCLIDAIYECDAVVFAICRVHIKADVSGRGIVAEVGVGCSAKAVSLDNGQKKLVYAARHSHHRIPGHIRADILVAPRELRLLRHRAETISGENGRIAIEEYVTHGTCRNDHMNGQTGAVGMEV